MVDQDNGYIIEKNDVSSLKESILSYYNLSETRKMELSECSYRKVTENFTWNKVADSHLKLFRELHKQLLNG